jgi:ATPase subunit of ABC transporter with duplicated ATPase domains
MISFRSAYGSLCPIPSFILHQVTCQFATGETLFGPLNFSLENSSGLVGRNGVGKTRLLRLLAGIDTPSGGISNGPFLWPVLRSSTR